MEAQENIEQYKERLRNAFPKMLNNDVDAVLGILPLAVNDIKLVDGRTHKVDNLIHQTTLTVLLDKEVLIIPYRLYFNEPDSDQEALLNETQQTILNCIYLRHHNGYLRQRRLEKLSSRHEYWVTPFTIQFLGEYVYEILEVLDNQVNEATIDNYRRFVEENLKYWQKTERRMTSYWNACYKLRFPKLIEYLGRRIVNRIKKASHTSNK